MAAIKISALPSISTALLADFLPVVQNSITSKATLEQLLSLMYALNICDLATTSNLTASYNNGTSGVGATLVNSGALSALSIDGVTVTLGMRILVKNQSTSLQNGVYNVSIVGDALTAWVLTRSTDYNQIEEIEAGDFFTIASGTINSKTQWIQTQTIVAVGVTSIIFESNIVASTGLTKTNNSVLSNSYSQYESTASAIVVNVASATLIATGTGTVTIPSNILKAGSMIHILAKGIYTTPAAPGNLTISTLLNATTNLTTGAYALTASLTNFGWDLECFLTVRTVGVGGTIIGQGIFRDQITTAIRFTRQMTNTVSVPIDTTIAQVINVTAAYSAPAATNSITSTNIIIKIYNV